MKTFEPLILVPVSERTVSSDVYILCRGVWQGGGAAEMCWLFDNIRVPPPPPPRKNVIPNQISLVFEVITFLKAVTFLLYLPSSLKKKPLKDFC